MMLNAFSYFVAAILALGSMTLSTAISRDLVPPIEDVSGAIEQDEYAPGDHAVVQIQYTRRIQVRVVNADYTLWCSEGKLFTFKPPRRENPRSWPVGESMRANMDFIVPDRVEPGSRCCFSSSITYKRIILPLMIEKVPPQSICFRVKEPDDAR